jgi:hypothetical protein
MHGIVGIDETLTLCPGRIISARPGFSELPDIKGTAIFQRTTQRAPFAPLT